jgi:hypothetical protein
MSVCVEVQCTETEVEVETERMEADVSNELLAEMSVNSETPESSELRFKYAWFWRALLEAFQVL